MPYAADPENKIMCEKEQSFGCFFFALKGSICQLTAIFTSAGNDQRRNLQNLPIKQWEEIVKGETR